MRNILCRIFGLGTRREQVSARPRGTEVRVPPIPCQERIQAALPAAAWIPLVLLLAAIAAGVACSKEMPAAASKPPVTLDPDVFETDHPELFKTAKAQTRPLPTLVTANGTVSPDVNRTIHVTSLGGGRVIDLKVKLGDTVKKGQTLLVISSPDLSAAMSDYQKAKADEVLSHKALDRAQMLLRPRSHRGQGSRSRARCRRQSQGGCGDHRTARARSRRRSRSSGRTP